MADIKRILVVGYGSMGRRRIRLASELISGVSFICVDSNPERQKQAAEAGHTFYASLEEGIAASPDVAFVCTSPGHHSDIIIPLLEAGIHVFTELNLTSDRYDEMAAVAKEQGVVLFVSSTLLYKKQMKFFKETVSEQIKPVTYMYHVGQYLPDWHPWECYKDFFVGKKETNGVRESMAIQLPWIVDTFGKIADVRFVTQRCTGLDIDFPDSVVLTIRHENGNIGTFLVDVVSRKATTHLEIIGEDVHIVWDGHNDDLYRFDIASGEMEQIIVYETEEHIDGYSDNIVEEPYREEIREFIKAVDGETVRYGLKDDREILGFIDSLESSCMEYSK